MERTIGNLREELKQHSDPYANLSQRASRRAQDLGDGFVLLRAKDEYNQKIYGESGNVIREWLEDVTEVIYSEHFVPSLQRWARLRLPNGQIARCAWKEKQKALNKVRISRNVCIIDPNEGKSYAEVQFFFQAKLADNLESFALVLPYCPPEQELLEASSNTLYVCAPLGAESMQVVNSKTISSVVGMVPFPTVDGKQDGERVFVVHKMGLEVESNRGVKEEDNET
ncbi:hypothetical protein MVEN_00114300 [Mycena venus]|uniref:Uncharacterized protein n=1 Tax=Mycena venus TaxID=2733690 RepID=A0A8H6Z7P2_9AGAR|nr:hypothetical protein MVEN_00114300 [Mycena venus]